MYINWRMNLWERGLHVGLVGDAEEEGDARESRASSGGGEEYEAVAMSYRYKLLSGKLSQAVRRATNREGGGCLLPYEQCTKTRRPVAEVLQEKYPDMHVPHMENPTCAAFEEYEDVPEMVPSTSRRIT